MPVCYVRIAASILHEEDFTPSLLFFLISPSFPPACTLFIFQENTLRRGCLNCWMRGLFPLAGRCFQHNNIRSSPGVQLTEESVQQSSGTSLTFSDHTFDHVRLGGCGFEARPGHSKELDLERGSMKTHRSLRKWVTLTETSTLNVFTWAHLWQETLTLNPPKLTLKLWLNHLFLQWKM